MTERNIDADGLVKREVDPDDVKVGDKLAHCGAGYPVIAKAYGTEEVSFAVQLDDEVAIWIINRNSHAAVVEDFGAEIDTLALLIRDAADQPPSHATSRTIAREILAAGYRQEA